MMRLDPKRTVLFKAWCFGVNLDFFPAFRLAATQRLVV
jgi:hypothetical protein